MKKRRHLVPTRLGQVHCLEAGAGSSGVLIFHINQQSSALCEPLVDTLAPHARIVAMDYPGHGMSDHVGFQPTIADYAECGQTAMRELGIGRYVVVGEATGAATAIETGIRDAEHVAGVALLNCPYYRDRLHAEERHASLRTGLRPADDTGFPLLRSLTFVIEQDGEHAPMHPTQAWMDRINRAQVEAGRDRWQALNALHAYDLAERLAQLDRDTVLLMGEHFFYAPYLADHVRRIRRLVAAEIVPGARFGMAWERPESVAPFIQRLLGQRASRSGSP
ncbi:alpha/beta fold hydrolase [Pigmentiphaga kullae]|uniref:Pimeloyl-ACP methyl ester carboxylesterase n=1 Tax=Pigmentiphaga kullae TaxID=151784 RepID=A0A4Q7NI90_9BURK|nr:alpha/beta hydrolase [Pigmentiphaga kullae]RZS84190.1 pimeloyl-ACP methyl ester carboxylesterase [Pigmentiphaga kullae]